MGSMYHFCGFVRHSVEQYSPQRHGVRRDRRTFLIKNSLLSVLRASALKTVADPSFGGSAVQSPSLASQESLKTLEKKAGLKRVFGDMRNAGEGQDEAYPNCCLFNTKRLHQLQKIFGFKSQQLGGGGAIAVGRGKRFQD
jgi:hypothetical protein